VRSLTLGAVPARTPGTLGWMDAADPSRAAELGDTPGPVGLNDHGDPTKRYRLLTGKQSQLHVQSRIWAMEPLILSEIALNALSKLKSPLLTSHRLPNSEPRTIASAPQSLSWPPEIQDQIDKLWSSTVEASAKYGPREYGATLAKDAHDQLELVNRHLGGSAGVQPDKQLVPGSTLVATVHTHPPEKSDLPGFSGGDIARMINDRDSMKILRYRGEEFVMLRTGETSSAILSQQEMQDRQLKIRENLVKAGSSERDAARQSARLLAQEYKLAYYEGSAGKLTKVSPSPPVSVKSRRR